jgi:hypothetical protein
MIIPSLQMAPIWNDRKPSPVPLTSLWPTIKRSKNDFIKEALLLRQALSLCSSLVERDLRVEAAFFESVRVLVMRL